MADKDERGRFVKGNKYRITSTDRARRSGSKGGKQSQAAAKERKSLRERLDLLDEQEIKNSKGEKATRADVIALQLCNKAIAGDLKAIRLKAEIQGELKREYDVNMGVPVQIIDSGLN